MAKLTFPTLAEKLLDDGVVRRITPGMISHDLASGIQPMTQPAGVVFSIKPRYSPLFKQCDCPCHENSAIMHIGQTCCDQILPVTLT